LNKKQHYKSKCKSNPARIINNLIIDSTMFKKHW